MTRTKRIDKINIGKKHKHKKRQTDRKKKYTGCIPRRIKEKKSTEPVYLDSSLLPSFATCGTNNNIFTGREERRRKRKKEEKVAGGDKSAGETHNHVCV